MSRLLGCAVAIAATLAVMAPAPAGAQFTHDKLTILTFSGPVQVPGATLTAGSYRFHLTNPETSRNVLQVLSKDGAIVYGMFNTTPTYRTVINYKSPVVTFMEAPAEVAPPIKTLFYEGDNVGYELVYPHGGPNLTPPVHPQPEITYSAAPAAIVAPEPAVAPPPPEPLPAAPVEAPPAPVELPKTGTPVPMFAAGGFATLLLGIGLMLMRRG